MVNIIENKIHYFGKNKSMGLGIILTYKCMFHFLFHEATSCKVVFLVKIFYLPRLKSSPRKIAAMKTVKMIDTGLNIEQNRGPALRTHHVQRM